MKILMITIDEYCSEIIIDASMTCFGIKLWTLQREFIKCHQDEDWVEFGTRRTVSKRTTQALNECLKNHNQYITYEE